jgi:hypothetical protein
VQSFKLHYGCSATLRQVITNLTAWFYRS